MSLILGLWFVLFICSLGLPPLLDDADATHAQAAQAMLHTGDWVTLHVDGVRYLEKPPLPYWIAALSLGLFGNNAFAVHLPLALTVLGLALLGYTWSRRVFSDRAALYTSLFLLTSAGTFLFTRIFIPDALLSLLLAAALYCFLLSLHGSGASKLYPYLMWAVLALAVLTKGLVAPAFFFGTALLFLAVTGQFHKLGALRPLTGSLLFVAIAAPWHVLAGLRNTGGEGGHGFFWFYFINEHVLRFLGRRIPRDYNKLPGYLYWSLHLVWLFPWSLFAPVALLEAWRGRRSLFASTITGRTLLLLAIFSALVLLFFSLSTNQEYYTFPVYLPLLMMLAAALCGAAQPGALRPQPEASTALESNRSRGLLNASFAAFTLIGFIIAAALFAGLYSSRHMASITDIGSVLAHRGVGDYTLSMSHLFDLTGPSFAALRLPAALAAAAFVGGPAIAWGFHLRGRTHAAVLMVVVTSSVFLIAAHIAFSRFAPMLSSQDFAATIQSLEQTHQIAPRTDILLYGDQANGSSIPFYLQRQVYLVDGRSTSMLFGSTFTDAPPIFLTPANLKSQWGLGARKILFVPLEQRDTVDHLLGPHQIVLAETSGKALLTDRPLDR